MQSSAVGLLLAVTLVYGADRRQSYSVLAPRAIRPNTNYYAAVSVDGTDGDLQEVELKITGRSSSGQPVEIRESSRIPPGETQLVRLNIGEIENGDYTLVATGSSPIQFQESTPLEYNGKGYSVFVQTDKPVYRPGNKVQFRVIVLSPQLKPTVTGSIDVEMRDGKGNLIKDWTRVFTTKGVYAESVELADKPVLGNWEITVHVNGQSFSKSFLVAEYVLPKFQVDVELPTFATFKEKVTATIKANYALGRPVKGTATVAVYPRYKSGYIQPIFSKPMRQTVDISGKVDIEFDLAKELSLTDDYDREVVFDVVVEEEKTKRRQNNTNSITLYKFAHKLELIKTADAYKPGMPYTCFLKISTQDGNPVYDDLNKVAVKSGFGSNTDAYATVDYPIPDDGIIRLAFFAPLDTSVDVLGIEAKYRDQSQWFSTVSRAVSNSNRYIQARLASENPRVNSNVKIALSTSEPIESFSYVILGRGNIVNAGTIRNPINTKHEFLLPTTRDMSPRARLVVSYIREDGEMISDSMDFEVEGVLSNSLDISIDRKQAFPGTTVDIEMKAKPNSFVGILAVDRSVRSLQNTNDITRDDMIDEVKHYNAGRDPTFYPWVQSIRSQQGSLSWHTGAGSSVDVFSESGLVVLTNGYLTNNPLTTEDGQNGAKNRTIGRPILGPGVSTVRPDLGPGVAYETATRPPLAGPYAFSRLPRPIDDLPRLYLRNDLPQTWLFTNATTNSEGNALLTVPVPESNATWEISGFAINQLDGVGIADEFAELELFQPFYVLVNLPKRVKVGETVAVEMVVFNYLSSEISTKVTLEKPNGKGFEFGAHPNAIEDGEEGAFFEFSREKTVSVRPGGRSPVSFIITPKTIGNLELKITSESRIGKDIKLEYLRVEGEGETMYENEAYLVDLTNKGEIELNITAKIPKHAVPDTQKVFVAAVPDPVGPAINNIQDLILKPTGCGEQTLASLVPVIILMDYLTTVGRSTFSIEQKGVHKMELGYQNELDFLRKDGSFSPFGNTDGFGSVWLTAQAAGALQGASRYIDVDPEVISKSLMWLVAKQRPDGSFKEEGAISHPLQENQVALTALTVLGFLDNKRNLTSTIRNSMNKAIDYLALNWEIVDNPYHLSVVTYALHKAIHPAKDQAWAVLESLSQSKGSKKWWERQLPEDWKANIWQSAPNTISIETTAYALLCLTERGGITDAVPVTNWLISQQNSIGSFASTSDTYVALRALTEFSIGFSIQNRNTDMSVEYAYLDSVRRMKVISSDPTTMQKRILPEETREVRIRATGNGLALIEVGYQFNLNVTAAWPSFVVTPQVTKISDSHHMQVTVCTHFIQKTNITGSYMSVIEVNLPSGFTVNQDALPALRRYKGVKRVETDHGDTKVIIYFTSIGKVEVCPTIEAFRTHRVANQRPAAIVVYDYYDQAKRARSFYDVVPATLCDICEGDDCPSGGCAARPKFPNYGSYAFNEAYFSENGGLACPPSLIAILALSVLALIRM